MENSPSKNTKFDQNSQASLSSRFWRAPLSESQVFFIRLRKSLVHSYSQTPPTPLPLFCSCPWGVRTRRHMIFQTNDLLCDQCGYLASTNCSKGGFKLNPLGRINLSPMDGINLPQAFLLFFLNTKSNWMTKDWETGREQKGTSGSW